MVDFGGGDGWREGVGGGEDGCHGVVLCRVVLCCAVLVGLRCAYFDLARGVNILVNDCK